MKKGANSEKALNKNALSEALISIDKVLSIEQMGGWPRRGRTAPLGIFRVSFEPETLEKI